MLVEAASGSSTHAVTELRQSLTAAHLSRVSLHRLRAREGSRAFKFCRGLLIVGTSASAFS